jgi:hypothetical protein
LEARSERVSSLFCSADNPRKSASSCRLETHRLPQRRPCFQDLGEALWGPKPECGIRCAGARARGNAISVRSSNPTHSRARKSPDMRTVRSVRTTPTPLPLEARSERVSSRFCSADNPRKSASSCRLETRRLPQRRPCFQDLGEALRGRNPSVGFDVSGARGRGNANSIRSSNPTHSNVDWDRKTPGYPPDPRFSGWNAKARRIVPRSIPGHMAQRPRPIVANPVCMRTAVAKDKAKVGTLFRNSLLLANCPIVAALTGWRALFELRRYAGPP